MKPQVKHGQSESITYSSWKAMIQRCHNPAMQFYLYYGGRGIAVCERWRNSFTDFLTDMGQRPSKGHSVERKDNSKGYEPGNCEWATRAQQQQNTRRNRLLTHEGLTFPLTEWARRKGLNPVTVRARLRLGWSVAISLDAPVRTKSK